MSRLKRRTALIALAALLPVLAWTGTAHANEVKGACVITGELKAVDKTDSRFGVRLVGGKAAVEADLMHVCTAVAKGEPDIQIMDTHAWGVYSSVACGTGKLVMGYQDVLGPPKYQNKLEGRKFSVELSAFAGTFYWHLWDKPQLPDLKLELLGDHPGETTPAKPRQRKDWQLAGAWVFALPNDKPQTVNDPPGNCTKAFSVAGAMVIDF